MQLARNTLLNVIGAGAPLVVALFAIPPLISALGTERFGLLTLIWAVVSYVGLFDLGLGRVLTRELAISFSRRDYIAVPSLVWTSLSAMTALGLFAGIFLWIAAPWLVTYLSDLPNIEEAVASARVLAIGVPFIVITAGQLGALQAVGAFGAINAIRVPLGMITFLGPLAVVKWGSGELVQVTWVLTVARIAAFVTYSVYMFRYIPASRTSPQLAINLVPRLLTLGGWMTLSNLINPLMGYLDRFVIGVILSVGVVAYYAIPNEMITKLWIIPGALTAVLFPRFAAYASSGNSEGRRLFDGAVMSLFAGMLPLVLGIALFAYELLASWIGPQYATQSAPVLQVFAFGILFNCMAHIPFSYLQSANGARTVALIYCIEAPVFFIMLVAFTSAYGIFGASLAWLARVLVDTVLMFFFSRRLFTAISPSRSRGIDWLIGLGSLLPFFGVSIGDPFIRATLVSIGFLPLLFWGFRIRRFFATDH